MSVRNEPLTPIQLPGLCAQLHLPLYLQHLRDTFEESCNAADTFSCTSLDPNLGEIIVALKGVFIHLKQLQQG